MAKIDTASPMSKLVKEFSASSQSRKAFAAALPSRSIDKAIVEACLLAHILVSKYVNHLPFYRQIQMFKRDFGWKLSQSTVSGWMASCCQLLEPLYNTLRACLKRMRRNCL